MLETSSVHISSGRLNVEWAVRQLSKSVAAMLDEATARAIIFFNRVLLLLVVNLLEMFYLCLQENIEIFSLNYY